MPNEDAYRKLFSAVGVSPNRRELRAASILIDDLRPGFGSLRYCDVAAGTVQRLSGEQIGVRQDMTPVEKDRAVSRASAWLNAHRNEH